MATEKPVKTKDLIRMVADSTDYHVYEVEDVISHLVAHMQNLLAENKSIKLNGIGTISRRKYKPREIKFEGREPVMVYNQVGIAIKMDFTMKNFLKDTFDASKTKN
jgi:nucleoid DNA-binding protein